MRGASLGTAILSPRTVTQLIFYSNPWLLPSVMFVVLGLLIELPYRAGKRLAPLPIVKDDAWNI